MLDVIRFIKEGFSGGSLITALILNLLLGGRGEKKQLPSRKGREICFSSNCLYFTQTCEKFLRRCKSSPLHMLLKQSDLKNPPHSRHPLDFPPLSAVVAWLATLFLSCAAGQGETRPKDYRHFPATSKAKEEKKKVPFSRGFYNKPQRVQEQRGASQALLRARTLDTNAHPRQPFPCASRGAPQAGLSAGSKLAVPSTEGSRAGSPGLC